MIFSPFMGVPLSYVRSHRCGLAHCARSAGGVIRVLAYVHRLLYRWVIVVPPIRAKNLQKKPSYGVPTSYVRSHRCGLARYARSPGGIRVLAYVHRLLYRQSSLYRLLGHKTCKKNLVKNFS